MAQKIPTNTSKINCLCGAVSEPGSSIVAEHFPISVGLCSCSICRRVTGALEVIPVGLHGKPSADALTACKVYTATDRAERYFCSTCGSHMFIRHSHSDKWFVLAGMIDRTDDVSAIDTINVTKIGFLGETGDGGIAGRLRSVALASGNSSAEIACYAGMPIPGTEVPLNEAEKLWQTRDSSEDQSDDKVRCACQCESVQFYITWPDPSRSDVDKLSRWLRSNNTKYVARLCVCRLCRLATSTPFVPWTYVMRENMVTSTGEQVDLGFRTKLENLKGAQIYYSSPDSKRSFCATCGSTLLFEAESRPQVINVSPGIIRSEVGSLAENILEWDWPRVSWEVVSSNPRFLRKLTARQESLAEELYGDDSE